MNINAQMMNMNILHYSLLGIAGGKSKHNEIYHCQRMKKILNYEPTYSYHWQSGGAISWQELYH